MASVLTLLYNINQLSILQYTTNDPKAVVAYANGDITQVNTAGGIIRLLTELVTITVTVELRSVERNDKSYQEEYYQILFATDTLTVASIGWTLNYVQPAGGGFITTNPYLQGYVSTATGGFSDWLNGSVTIQFNNLNGQRTITILGPPLTNM